MDPNLSDDGLSRKIIEEFGLSAEYINYSGKPEEKQFSFGPFTDESGASVQAAAAYKILKSRPEGYENLTSGSKSRIDNILGNSISYLQAGKWRQLENSLREYLSEDVHARIDDKSKSSRLTLCAT